MGLDISGGMIIGCDVDKVNIDNEDIYEWAEDNDMKVFSKWYDAGIDGLVLGLLFLM